MYKNGLYLALIVLFFGVAIGYTGMAGWKYNQYRHLSSSVESSEIEWLVKRKSGDFFVPYGKYHFTVHEKEFSGEAPLEEQTYRNSYAVERDLPKMSERKWTIWYDPVHPEKNALQKAFPVKECISAIVLWGIVGYFVGLGLYMASDRRTRRDQ